MDTTRISLLNLLSQRDENAWRELDKLYRPLIFNWLRRYQLATSDAEDIAQEVMTVVSKKIAQFEHNGRKGASRLWLKTITIHSTQNYLDKHQRQPQTGSVLMQGMIAELQDPNSELSAQFDREHDQHVLRMLLDRLSSQFQGSTLEAFRLHVLQGLSVQETAAQLGLATQTVYVAKSRVLRSLREQAEGWIDQG